MTATKPSLDLLRSMTDELAVRALASEPRLTRAEIASMTGLSKPTVADSVRRLEGAGLVADTGLRTTGRGGVGSYYSLAPAAGCALVVHIGPDGIIAESVDAFGRVLSRAEQVVPRPATRAVVTRTLKQVARRSLVRDAGPCRVAVVSAADPVDRATGRLVQLPDAPFLVGALSPAVALRSFVHGPVLVDNDVNWAARAERAAHPEGTMDDFAYVYLGDGVGCALVSDGELVRGHAGIAGEIAHVTTMGPDGGAVAFTEVFAALGLRRSGSTSIDVERLVSATAQDPALTMLLARAVVGVLAAAIAFSDPSCIVLGGPWADAPQLLEGIRSELAGHARSVPVLLPAASEDASLAGARAHALVELHAALVRIAVDEGSHTAAR
jgi:predicted NBD/HSP70 family sugar kinase